MYSLFAERRVTGAGRDMMTLQHALFGSVCSSAVQRHQFLGVSEVEGQDVVV